MKAAAALANAEPFVPGSCSGTPVIRAHRAGRHAADGGLCHKASCATASRARPRACLDQPERVAAQVRVRAFERKCAHFAHARVAKRDAPALQQADDSPEGRPGHRIAEWGVVRVRTCERSAFVQHRTDQCGATQCLISCQSTSGVTTRSSYQRTHEAAEADPATGPKAGA